MTKYLQRISFCCFYYDPKVSDELLRINKNLDSLTNKSEYIGYFKDNPNSIKCKHDFLQNRMNGMASFIGSIVMDKIGKKYEIENTGIININLSNRDLTETFLLGNSHTFSGSLGRFFDWEEFIRCNDKDKRELLLQFTMESLLIYAKKFQLNTESIIAARKSLMDSDLYYTDSKHVYLKRNKYKLFKTKRYNFKTTEWGILYLDLNTGEKKVINICEKEHFFGVEHPWLGLSEIMKVPMFLKYDGVNKEKNIFEMSYGSEKYSIDLQTLKKNNR